MCSNPKSSGSQHANKRPAKGVLSELSANKRFRFAEIANRADQKRRLRKQQSTTHSETIALNSPLPATTAKRRHFSKWPIWLFKKDLIHFLKN